MNLETGRFISNCAFRLGLYIGSTGGFVGCALEELLCLSKGRSGVEWDFCDLTGPCQMGTL